MDKAEAPCKSNPDQWFSERPRSVERAIALCQTCPLIAPCRKQGENEEYGVWGGVKSETPDKAAIQAVERAERNAQVQALHAEGHAPFEIGKLLGLPRTTVSDIVHAA